MRPGIQTRAGMINLQAGQQDKKKITASKLLYYNEIKFFQRLSKLLKKRKQLYSDKITLHPSHQ